MNKRGNWIVTILFLAFIAVFFFLLLFLPKREFSERENRYLEQRPSFSFSALTDGTFTKDFESFISDQFPLRDAWTSLKARTELALGKSSNNGVYYCKGGVLIEGAEEPDAARLSANIQAVNQFAASVDCPVAFQLIPGANCVWADKLPSNAPNYDMKQVIDQVYSQLQNVTPIDVYSTLMEHKDEYIYYHTDHHWTTLGAFYSYQTAAKALGLTPASKEAYTPEVASDSFYGTVYSSSGFSWVPTDTIEYWVPDDGTVHVTNYPNGSPVEGKLYDRSFLEKKDKYSSFFGGNTPMLEIDTGTENAPTLLVIRDSYADSQNPFWFQHYSKIWVLDMRYFKNNVRSFVEEHDIDQVLLTYSVANFTSDTNVFLLGR